MILSFGGVVSGGLLASLFCSLFSRIMRKKRRAGRKEYNYSHNSFRIHRLQERTFSPKKSERPEKDIITPLPLLVIIVSFSLFLVHNHLADRWNEPPDGKERHRETDFCLEHCRRLDKPSGAQWLWRFEHNSSFPLWEFWKLPCTLFLEIWSCLQSCTFLILC